MPSRALLCLTLSPAAPSLTRGEMPTLASPFGRWLHGQVLATSRQWPAVVFHRLWFIGSEVRLLLLLRHSAPPLVAGLAVAHALEREVARAARSVGWIEAGNPLWREGGTVVVAVRSRPERSEGPAWRPFGEVRPRIPFALLRVT